MPQLPHNSARLVMLILLSLLAWSVIPSSRADEERWWGEITDISLEGDIYTVQIKDGRLFNVVWKNGNSDWNVGDTVILSVNPGFGFMVYGTRQTQVWVEETGEAASAIGGSRRHLGPTTLAPGGPRGDPSLERC